MKQRNALTLLGLLLASLLPVVGRAAVGDTLDGGSIVIWEGSHSTNAGGNDWGAPLTIESGEALDVLKNVDAGSVISVEYSNDGQIQLCLYGTGAGSKGASEGWYSLKLNNNEWDDCEDVTAGKWTHTVAGGKVAFSSKKEYGQSNATDIEMIKSHGIQVNGNHLTITRVSVKSPIKIDPIARVNAQDGDNVWYVKEGTAADGTLDAGGSNLMLRQDLRYKVGDKIRFVFTDVTEDFKASLWSFNPYDASVQPEELMALPLINNEITVVIDRNKAALLNNDYTALRVNGSNGTMRSATYVVYTVPANLVTVAEGETVTVFDADADDKEKKGVLGTDWTTDCSMNVKLSKKYHYEVGGLVTVEFSSHDNTDARVQIFENTYGQGLYGDGYLYDIATIADRGAGIDNLSADGKFTFSITPQISGRLDYADYVCHIRGINGTVSKITYTAPTFKVPADAVDILNLRGSNDLSEGGDWQNNGIYLSHNNVECELYGRIRVYLACDGGDDRVPTNVNQCTQVEIQRRIEGDYHRAEGLYQFLVAAPADYVEWVITTEEQLAYLNDPKTESIIKGQNGHVLGVYYLPPVEGITETPHAYKNMGLDTFRQKMEPKYGVVVYFNDENKTGNVGGASTAGLDNIKGLNSRDVVYVVYRAIDGNAAAPSVTVKGGSMPLTGAIVSGPDANGYYSAEYTLSNIEAYNIKQGGLEVVTDNENTSVWTVSLVSFLPGGTLFKYQLVEGSGAKYASAHVDAGTDAVIYSGDVVITGFNTDFGAYDKYGVDNNKEAYPVEGRFPEDIALTDLELELGDGTTDKYYKVVGVTENAFDVDDTRYTSTDFYGKRGKYNLPNVDKLGVNRGEFFAKYWRVTVPAYPNVAPGAFRNSPFGIVKVLLDDIPVECFQNSKKLNDLTFASEQVEDNTGAEGQNSDLPELMALITRDKTIGARAFAGTDALTSLTLPREVTVVGADAFSGAPLTELTLNGRRNPEAADPVDNNPYTKDEWYEEYLHLATVPEFKTEKEKTDWYAYMRKLADEHYEAMTELGLPENSDASAMKIYPGAFDGMISGTIDLTGCEVPPMCVDKDGKAFNGYRGWHSFYFISNTKAEGSTGSNGAYEVGNMPEMFVNPNEGGDKLTPFGQIVSAHKEDSNVQGASDQPADSKAMRVPGETGKVTLRYVNDSAYDELSEASQYKASPVWTLFFDRPENSYTWTGVEDVADDMACEGSDEITEVWTLDGVGVNPESLAPGFYIVRRADGTTSKIRIVR